MSCIYICLFATRLYRTRFIVLGIIARNIVAEFLIECQNSRDFISANALKFCEQNL